MKKTKWKIPKFRLQKVDMSTISEKTLLINLYFTQMLTLLIGLAVLLFQQRNMLSTLAFPTGSMVIWIGIGLAAVVLAFDLLVSRFIPESVADDGGVNDLIFRNRAIWHIALISAIVAICEEILFRGAIQHAFGPYWTSILFTAIHVRYLRHWIPTGMVFCISYALGWSYDYTDNLWTPIIAHFLIDCVMGLIIRYRKE